MVKELDIAMDKFLEVRNLSVTLNGNPILDGLNFEVSRGDTIAIIGPNGAGKTVLFRTLLGLLPYSGKIIWHQPPKFGYVPQRFEYDHTFPLSVEEFFLLKTGHRFWLKAKTKEKIRKSLKEVGMEGVIDRRLGELSAGQLQRILIAYALWGDPNVLLFDEPTANVDVGQEATIYELLDSIAKSRYLTLFVISHDLSIIFAFADRVVCLNRAMLCYGVPQKVLTPAKLAELYRTKVHFFDHTHRH
ncbi:MAG: metal ABC transporter ATP-binding protein [Candidatus Paceibacteria bacterium]